MSKGEEKRRELLPTQGIQSTETPSLGSSEVGRLFPINGEKKELIEKKPSIERI